MKFIHAQFMLFMGHSMRAHAEIVSGAYRLTGVKQGIEGGMWRDLTNDELLARKVDEMNRHLHRAQECLEHESFNEG